MADVNPLKLVDLGSGQGELREMQAGDKIPGGLLSATEWAAETVSQAEAEAGTATTRRAWTAERVRQAILGWWNGATSAFGRGFVAAADAAAGRQTLVLDHPTLRQYGAVNDGATNADAALAAAIAAGRQFNLPAGDYLVTGVTNPLGVEMHGDGRLIKAVTGGRQQLSSDCDRGSHLFGQEYLYAFHTKLLAGFQGAKVVCSGDSTTSGLYPGLDEPYYLNQMVASTAADRGFSVESVNSGKFGKYTAEWLSTYLTEDMALNPDLYIVRWGLNDPLVSGRTLAAFAADLRQGLANIRASKPLNQLSILLMTPNSTADTAAGRDEAWHEKVRLIYRQAARDYKCAFIDTYALWRDSRVAAGLWMDDIGGGVALHPKSVMNVWISSRIGEFIYPQGLCTRVATKTVNVNDPPSSYPLGYSTRLDDNTFAGVAGMVTTFRGVNGVCFQIVNSAFDASILNNGYPVAQVAMRSGLYLKLENDTIDRWHTTWDTQPSVDIPLSAGWVMFSATNKPRASKSNNVVTLSGCIKSGRVTAGTVIATLPAGFRPRNDIEHFLVATNVTTTAAACRLAINAAGQITIIAGANAAAVYLGSISFEAGA